MDMQNILRSTGGFQATRRTPQPGTSSATGNDEQPSLGLGGQKERSRADADGVAGRPINEAKSAYLDDSTGDPDKSNDNDTRRTYKWKQQQLTSLVVSQPPPTSVDRNQGSQK